MTGCVIDASAVLAWCFEDEGGAEADALIEQVAADGATVPVLFSWRAEPLRERLAGHAGRVPAG